MAFSSLSALQSYSGEFNSDFAIYATFNRLLNFLYRPNVRTIVVVSVAFCILFAALRAKYLLRCVPHFVALFLLFLFFPFFIHFVWFGQSKSSMTIFIVTKSNDDDDDDEKNSTPNSKKNNNKMYKYFSINLLTVPYLWVFLLFCHVLYTFWWSHT